MTTTTSQQHFAPVDGLRAISTLSLVALHCTIVTSALLPARGEVWNAFATHPLYGLFQGGGCQVDVFLLLSGFLLGVKFVNLRPGASVLNTVVRDAVLRRACRLWPVLIGVALFGIAWLGEGEDNAMTVAQVLSFSNNYFDVRKYGRVSSSFCLSSSIESNAQNS